jgi:hypothetical protein
VWQLGNNYLCIYTLFLTHNKLLHVSPIIVACVYIFVVDDTVYVKPIEPSCSSRQREEEEKKEEEKKNETEEEEKSEGKF